MLNTKQQEVVNSKANFIFLLAGAGTGKTTVIVSKIIKLLDEGVMPENVLVLSFTRKSTSDLKRKLKDYENLSITTFHGFCYQVLNSEKEIKIVEEKWLIENGYSLDELTKIDFYKRSNKEPLFVKKYNKLLKENGLLDYTDLEHIIVNKLKTNKTFKEQLRNKFKYIFIDEFQDTSVIQYALLKEIIRKHSTCFCVGDPNQSIYAFRGASEKVIKYYIKDYNAIVYLLNINYRSGVFILDASNNLIKHNKSRYHFNLTPAKKESGKVIYKTFSSNDLKNKYIINEVRMLLGNNYIQEEIAIIYRNHHFANKIKKELFKTYFDRINYLSIHQAKGLEFDVVFFIGLEENKIPFISANIEEERRLFYVAITRARKVLYLLNYNKKKQSRFVSETTK